MIDMPNGETRALVKDMTLVTCEYHHCPFIGEFTQCYLSLEKNCMRYDEYIQKLNKGDLGERSKV